MPELPEVETIASNLRTGVDDQPSLLGQVIDSVTMNWPKHIAKPPPQTFAKKIRGRKILDVDRRGKYLIFSLDQDTMLIHLRMTGDLKLAREADPEDRYSHTIFNLQDGWELRFSDARKFGRVFLLEDPDEILFDLGPEPLSPEFTAKQLADMLAGRHRAIKPLLLDQHFIAGIGNIYADESLHRAGLHPLRRSDTLNHEEVEALWSSIGETLRDGIRHNGASLDWVYRGGSAQHHFRVYGRKDEPCETCGTPIERIVVAQRGTYFCPDCQLEKSL